MRYDSTRFNRIVADKSHRVTVAYLVTSSLWTFLNRTILRSHYDNIIRSCSVF